MMFWVRGLHNYRTIQPD